MPSKAPMIFLKARLIRVGFNPPKWAFTKKNPGCQVVVKAAVGYQPMVVNLKYMMICDIYIYIYIAY